MKVAICIPTRDQLHAKFAFDLAQLVGYTAGLGIVKPADLSIIINSGSILINQRNELVEDALSKGADWLLWLDTDMRFPKKALEGLLRHRRSIVAANYLTRKFPHEPVARFVKDDGIVRVSSVGKTGLEECDATGFGVALVNANVFKQVEKPWFFMPWSTVNNVPIGEDIFFCMKAQKAGHPTYIDHDLSQRVKHIGDFEFGQEHAQALQDG